MGHAPVTSGVQTLQQSFFSINTDAQENSGFVHLQLFPAWFSLQQADGCLLAQSKQMLMGVVSLQVSGQINDAKGKLTVSMLQSQTK